MSSPRVFSLLLILIFCSMAPRPAGAQDADVLLERAMGEFSQGDHEQAESTLRNLLEQRPGLPEAHYWLSRALDGQGRYDEAEKAVKEALKTGGAEVDHHIQLARILILRDKKNDARKILDEAEKLAPELAEVHYYRGRTYGRVRLALFRPKAAKREFQLQIDSYQRAIELNLRHPDAYFRLGYAFEAVEDDPETALDWYFRQATINPGHGEALNRLAFCAIQLKDYQKGFALLQRVAGSQGPSVNPLVEGLSAQLEAYHYHTLEQHERAYHAMRRYVAVLSDIDPEEVAVFKDLSGVASSDEAEAYREASDQEKEELWRVYWAARDSDPTTRINERLVEHYRRMVYSRLHFSMGKEPWDRRGEIYIRFGHPDDRQHFLLKSGEDVVRAIFPTGIRAVDMIREQSRQRFNMEVSTGTPNQELGYFGERAMRETRSIAFPTESWVYVPFGLEIFFTDQRNSKVYDYPLQMIDLPEVVSSSGLTNRLAYRFLNSPRREAEELIRKVPESHRHDYGGEQLTFVYHLASFKGVEGKADVEVAYSVPTVQLGSVEDGLGENTWLSGRIALRDKDFAYVQGMPFSMGPLDRPASEEDNLRLNTGAFVFRAPPGEYKSAVSLQDSLSRKFGIYTSPLHISDFAADRLQLSDIKLAASIIPSEGTGLFVRNGLHITPHPARLYSRSTPVFIYYEIYNLTRDADGRTGFSTELEIAAREPNRNFALRLLTSLGRLVTRGSDDQSTYVTFEDSGASKDEHKYTSIETTELDPGIYTLTLTITDTNSEMKASRTVDFIVVRG